jgi:hypothetical protein
MAPRQQLHDIFEDITENVYFQPPANVSMKYPAIVYARDNSRTEHADNEPYRVVKRYQVTVIDRNPDSTLPDQVDWLPQCSFIQFFAADNLNHWIYNLFF